MPNEPMPGEWTVEGQRIETGNRSLFVIEAAVALQITEAHNAIVRSTRAENARLAARVRELELKFMGGAT